MQSEIPYPFINVRPDGLFRPEKKRRSGTAATMIVRGKRSCRRALAPQVRDGQVLGAVMTAGLRGLAADEIAVAARLFLGPAAHPGLHLRAEHRRRLLAHHGHGLRLWLG